MGKQILYRGEDRSLIFTLRNSDTSDPFPLTGWTKITAVFKGNYNNSLSKVTDPINTVKAIAEHSGVSFNAVEVGVDGNDIVLTFDNVKTIQEVMDTWNTANPTKLVEAAAGTTLSQVLPVGVVPFSGGYDGDIYVEVINEDLGKISVKLTESDTNGLRIGPDQSVKIIVDKGTERRIALVRNQLDVEDPII